MELNNAEWDNIMDAAKEYFAKKKITQKCPKCGKPLNCQTNGDSYLVFCETENCVSESFHGI